MPRGDKSKYTEKQERKADHIAEGYERRGVPEKEAERRAWATVNKDEGAASCPADRAEEIRPATPPHIKAAGRAAPHPSRGPRPADRRPPARRPPRASEMRQAARNKQGRVARFEGVNDRRRSTARPLISSGDMPTPFLQFERGMVAALPVQDHLAVRGFNAHGGTVTLRCREREASATQGLSGLCDRVPPRGHRRSAKRTVGLG